ncbi:MAG: hypothetical protein JNN15_01935 [Blastocatellia bacterium]|nr:hypothetical protein [Blastocatellia bacterium]
MKHLLVLSLFTIFALSSQTFAQGSKTLTNDDFSASTKESSDLKDVNFDKDECFGLRKVGPPNGVLLDGAVMQTKAAKLKVTKNSGSVRQLTDDRYEQTLEREVVNESKESLMVWSMLPIFANQPSEYKVYIDDKEAKWKLFEDAAALGAWRNCAGTDITLNSLNRPHLFTVLGKIPPNGKRQIKIVYQGQGQIKVN